MSTQPSGRLAGKVTLITGTASGQGRAAAELFAREGALVVGCDVDVAGAEQTCDTVTAAGGTMHSMAPVDLSDLDAAREWVEQAASLHGGIDVLYNNASATRVGPFEELTFEDWRFVMSNELDLIYTVTKAAWPHLVARGEGVIINTASVSAYRGALFTQQAAHGAAKGGVLAMTRHLAASGVGHNIRVNSISPGLTITGHIEKFLEDPGHPMHDMARANPLGRLGLPIDVAKVALFLASDDSAYLNAIDIIVDGGQSVIV